MKSHPHVPTGRLAWPAVAVGVAALLALPGCTESVAPPPTGQVDNAGGGGGYAAPPVYSSDMAPAPSATAGSSGQGASELPAKAHSAATTPDTPGKLGGEFYAAASEAGARGPGGPAVEPDAREAGAIEKAAAGYPALHDFDRAGAKGLPAPDPKASYVTVVDPADGEAPPVDEGVELEGSGSDIDGVRFSSPAAGQAVVSMRVTEPGKADRGRLDRYDLATGERVSRAELPDRAALLDVSPDGTRALVRLAFGLTPDARPTSSQTRLDVWELSEAEGRHVAGWRPGAKENGTPSVPVGAVFLDGDRVATLTDDGALTLWNLAESRAVYTVESAGRGPLLATPGRKYLASFTGTTFATFEAETGTFRGLLTPPRPTLAECRAAGFSPDGKQLAAVLRRPAQSLLGWDVETGRPGYEIEAPLGLGRGVHAGSPGYVVAGGVLFDTAAKKPVWLYAENEKSRNVAVSPDRRHWVVTQPSFKPPLLAAVEAPTNAVAIAGRSAGELATLRLAPGDALAVKLELANYKGDRKALEAAFARSLGRALSDRGFRLDPSAGQTLDVKATERSTGETITFDATGAGGDETVPAHEIDFTVAVSDANGKTLWSDKGQVPPSYFVPRREGMTLEQVLLDTLWQAAPSAVADAIERSMPSYLREVPPESVLGRTRLWVAADDVALPGAAPVASAEPGRASGADSADSAPVRQPEAIVPMPNGAVRDLLIPPPPLSLVVTATDDRMIRLWEPRTRRMLDEMPYKSAVTKLAAHPGGSQFLFGTEDGQVRVYDLARKRSTVGYDGSSGEVTALAVTSEPTVVAGTRSGRVVRWTEGEKSKPAVVAEGGSEVTGLAAVPYENRVVAAWADGTAKLLDVGTNQVVTTYDLKAGPIHGAAVSANAQTAVFATENSGAVLVAIATGKETGRFDRGAVTAVAYRPDGMQLATANRFGRIALWNLAAKEAAMRLEGAGGQVSKVLFSPDSLHVLAAVAGRRAIPSWNLAGGAQGGGVAAPAAHDAEPVEPGDAPRAPFGRPPGRRFGGPVGAHSG